MYRFARQKRKDTSISPQLLAAGRRNGFANTTTAIRTVTGGSHPSVWEEPIADYKEAVKRGIAELEKRYAYAWEHISDSCNYNPRKIRQLLAKLKEDKQQYLEPKQLSLF